MALTEETILTFLLEHGGKVKNSDLLNHFKPQINCCDPAEKKHNRDLFKTIINSVAVVKQIDDVKFVVVKKRFHDFVKGGMHLTTEKSDLDERICSQNTSFSPSSSEHSEYSAISKSVKILNVSADQGIRKTGKTTGPVFAIVAVKSPPQSQREDPVLVRQDGQKTSEILSMLEQRPPTPLPPEAAVTPKPPGRVSSEWGTGTYTSPGAKIRHPELGETPQTSGSPQLRRTPDKLLKQGNDTTNDLTKDANKVSNKDVNNYSDQSVPLEAAAHEWLVKSAAGLWGQIYGLLLQDPQLAEKKDFISGFTALHWAAKGGNADMVRNILDISRKRGTEVDVNSRTQAGYTPLHIAVIHGHDGVITLLVRDYGASVNIRDNDGKRPYHYLEKGVSSELRELLGDPQASQQDRRQDKPEDEEDKELPRGLNTLSRLIGHRKRHKHHAGEDPEDDRKDGPQPYYRRHFSDMFYHH
ncbi:unnamed protein product [Coregonus sp. 'balchen']|nr:unnamed protein product [Coregonus sp. 'balchen']